MPAPRRRKFLRINTNKGAAEKTRDLGRVLERVNRLEIGRRPGIVERNRQIVIRRFGLDGWPPQTVAQIAKQHEISEKLVYFILKKALKKLGEDPVLKQMKDRP